MPLGPEILPAVGYAAGFFVQVFAALRRVGGVPSETLTPRTRPPRTGELTVLQPVLGGDPTLEDTLYATAAACAPHARFVWAVDTDDEVGRAAAQAAHGRLDAEAANAVEIREVPPVAELAKGDTRPINPKSAKLAVCLADVTTPLVAVLDDDTTVGLEHLARAAKALGKGSDRAHLYTGLPSYAVEGRALGSVLTAGFVNASSARTYLGALALGGPLSINGMFWMTRTEELRGLGGFDAVRHQLCDDLAIAELYRAANRRIEQGATAQVLVTRDVGLGEYARRMHRWFVFARVLLARVGWMPRIAVATFGLGLPLLLWGVLACAFTGSAGAIAAGAVIVLRQFTLEGLLVSTRDPSAPREAHAYPFSALAAEVLIPLHAVHALFVPTIRWRTRTYSVGRRGTFEERGA